MITQSVVGGLHDLFAAAMSFLAGVLPSPPAFWTQMTSALNIMVGQIPGAVSYFVPIAPVIALALALLALYPPLIAVRLGRRLLSLFTGGGGGA